MDWIICSKNFRTFYFEFSFKIHRYVNFESILKGNQVGVYAPNRRPSLSAPQGADLVVTNLHSSANKPGERKLTCFNKLVRFYKGGYLTCFGIPPSKCFAVNLLNVFPRSLFGKDPHFVFTWFIEEEYEDEMIPSTKFSEDRNFCFYTVRSSRRVNIWMSFSWLYFRN